MKKNLNRLDKYEYHLDADTDTHAWHQDRYPGGSLFEFDTFTFTNCAQVDRYGPTYTVRSNFYAPLAPTNPWLLDSDLNIDNFPSNGGSHGWQEMRVPGDGPYTLSMAGASSVGPKAGRGIIVTGTFNVPSNYWSFLIVVGQNDPSFQNSTGGGGASWLAARTEEGQTIANSQLIAVAGGGGGQHSPPNSTSSIMDARFGETGGAGGCGSGGTNGNGGNGCPGSGASGGGGYISAGGSGTYGTGGQGFNTTLAGGDTSSTNYGGFGGGGGTHGNTAGGGGGGGYSGGGAGHHSSRGGGGADSQRENAVIALEEEKHSYSDFSM